MEINREKFSEEIKLFLDEKYNIKNIEKANATNIYNAVSGVVLKYINDNWENSTYRQRQEKYAAYLSMEFLTGRLVHNNLCCLGILEDVDEVLKKIGVEGGVSAFEEIEDNALGNGGLGRLAACFLDSAATLNIPLIGHGIRYKYGLFKQSFEGGEQVESADNWLAYGDPWGVRKASRKFKIEYADMTINAIPYDYPVIGYDTFNIGTMRLWQAEEEGDGFELEKFNNQEFAAAIDKKTTAESISAVLYPKDNSNEGKKLRIRQEYFFSSAAIQDILRNFEKFSKNYSELPNYISIQLNDTHPVIAIPELIWQLGKKGVSFEEAFGIVVKIFNYTNHTVMPEALEKWDFKLIEEILPHIAGILIQLNEKLIVDLYKNLTPKSTIDNMKIIRKGVVHMTNLACYIGKYINGVAAIHSEILKDTLLKDFYAAYPKKFQNKTNGITPRRWLALCNPELTALFTQLHGDKSFLTDLSKLKSLEKYAKDEEILKRFISIKQQKKQQLNAYSQKLGDDFADTNWIFDVQIKRLHEYKRQLLNAFSILWIYFGIKDGSIENFQPTAFIFGGKAAPGYERAKAIILFINKIAELVNNDSDVNKLIKVIFVKNYNVSYAEKLIPAADISEQISPAGTEASGTGNMKFMLNGAVTLGTLDGANVEIVEEAGIENNYIFGAKIEDIEKIKKAYDPREIMAANPKINRVISTLIDGTFSDNGRRNGEEEGSFRELYYSLLDGASWHTPDRHYLLLDIESYVTAKLIAIKDYAENREKFAEKQWLNAVNAGKFSSDRTILQYAEQIWKL